MEVKVESEKVGLKLNIQKMKIISGPTTSWKILEFVGPWVVLRFSVGMEAFDELLSINVPWSQEFSVVLRIWI